MHVCPHSLVSSAGHELFSGSLAPSGSIELSSHVHTYVYPRDTLSGRCGHWGSWICAATPPPLLFPPFPLITEQTRKKKVRAKKVKGRKEKEEKMDRLCIPWGWSLAARLKWDRFSINWQRHEPTHQVWVTLSMYSGCIYIFEEPQFDLWAVSLLLLFIFSSSSRLLKKKGKTGGGVRVPRPLVGFPCWLLQFRRTHQLINPEVNG